MTNLLTMIRKALLPIILLLATVNFALAFGDEKPLSFIENKGQLIDQYSTQRNDIDFSINANGMNIFISNGKLQYQWVKTITNGDTLNSNESIIYNRIEMILVGANTSAVAIVDDKQPYYETHFLKHNGEEVQVHTFNKITYKNVYPNIDWVLYSKNGQLKYDFVVHPNGNIADIKLQYNGAENVTLKEGTITADTKLGSITEQAPYTYDADTKTPLHSAFTLRDNTISFEVAAHKGTIIIDPYLEWATYYGGTLGEWGMSTSSDFLGNVYLFGHANSTNNIATIGSFQDTLTKVHDSNYINYDNTYLNSGFIAKFNKSGQRIWATYYPGRINAGIANAIGTIYITGNCDSIPYIATPGAHQPTFTSIGGTPYSISTNLKSNHSGFIAKIDSSGSRVWGTFYGGERHDFARTIALDKNGNVYIGGRTHSDSNIATLNAYQDTINRSTARYSHSINLIHIDTSSAGFLTKFNTNGVRQWGTYFSGEISCIAVDSKGDVVVAGTTSDSVGVATSGTFIDSCKLKPIDICDGFIAKFNTYGNKIWGTYYGGEDCDGINSVAVDDSDNIYILGLSFSQTGMTTIGAFQPNSYYKIADLFIAKISPDGTNRYWGTYYGGLNTEYPKSIAVGFDKKLYVHGITLSTDSIATSGGLSTSIRGASDDFLAQFDLNGSREWATYIGGYKHESTTNYIFSNNYFAQDSHNNYYYNNSITISPLGKIYVSGTTNSANGLVSNVPHQSLLNSTGQPSRLMGDAYLMSIAMDTVVYIKHPWSDSSFCVGDTLRVPYGVNVSFPSGNVFTVQLSDTDGNFTSPTNIGSITANNDDTITCIIPQVPTGYEYRIRIVSSTPVKTSADNQFDISIFAPPTSLTATNNGSLCIGDSLSLIGTHSGGTSSGLSYKWTGPNSFTAQQKDTSKLNISLIDTGDYILTVSLQQCSIADTTHIDVYTIPAAPIASVPQLVCFDSSLLLSATHSSSSATYIWTGPNGYTSNNQNPTISNTVLTNAGKYIVTATVNGCTSSADTAFVAIQQTSTPQANSNSPVCAGQQIILTASSVNNATYNWRGPNNFTTTQQNPSIPNSSATHVGTYYVKAIVNGCESLEDSASVIVNPTATINIYSSPSDSICAGETATFIAITNNAGSSPTFTWLNGGSIISGASSSSYSSNSLSNGAAIQCLLSSIANCPGHTDTSNMVVMNVRPVTAPTVSITANPNTPLEPMELVTFTATTTYGGNNPTFQWMRNGNPVVGATNNVWGTYQMSDGDSIYVVLTSSDRCADPDTAISNGIKIAVLVSVDDIGTLGNVTLFPNPNSGTFTIKGQLNSSKKVTINVMNAIGQTVYRGTAKPNGTELKHTVNIGTELATGTYILHLQNEDAAKTLRFTISK